jgi:predicted methyltransferase
VTLAACSGQAADSDRPITGARISPRGSSGGSGGSNEFSTEVQRDSVNEAQVVMDLAQIAPGMTVADIGAGEGYYTVRLAERVGAQGRVLAQDIDAGRSSGLASGSSASGSTMSRSSRARRTIRACLPNSFDRVFLVHMYHEVASLMPSCGGCARR